MSLIRLKHVAGDDLTAERGSKRMYTRTYIGLSNDPLDDPLTIRNDPQCPKELDFDPFDKGCLITTVRVKRRSMHALKTWDITVTSTTEFAEGEEKNPNPLDRATYWEAETVLYEVPITRDITGKLITNTAGDLFEGAKDYAVGWTFKGEKNLRNAPLDFIDDFVNCVNDSTITIDGKRCAERTVWFRAASVGKVKREFGVLYRPTTFTLEYNPLGWEFAPLNRGFREVELVEETSSLGTLLIRRFKEITDDANRQISQPVFLNADGAVHRVIDPQTGLLVRKIPLDPGDIITLKFKIKHPKPFRKLGVLS